MAASAGQKQKGSFRLSGSASASPVIAHHLRVHTWGRDITLPSPCSLASPEQVKAQGCFSREVLWLSVQRGSGWDTFLKLLHYLALPLNMTGVLLVKRPSLLYCDQVFGFFGVKRYEV